MSRIDWVLVPRLIMGGAMCYVGYDTNDMVSGGFGLFFIIYSLIGAKYKIGCGYTGCGYTPRGASTKERKPVEFTEVK